MKDIVNKKDKEAFVTKFMQLYISPGLNKPYIRMAYGQRFELTELRNTYRVTIRGITRRYSNLFEVGEFIYNENFNPLFVYMPPLSEKKVAKLQRTKQLLTEIWNTKILYPVRKHATLYAVA